MPYAYLGCDTSVATYVTTSPDCLQYHAQILDKLLPPDARSSHECSFVLWSREGWHLCISLEPDEIRVRFSHSHCFCRDGRPTIAPKCNSEFGKHRLRGASVLHRYAAPRSLPCFIPTLLGHHSSRGSRPDTETLHTQPLLADGARRSLAAAPLPRHLHHTHRPPPTPDEPAARAADRRRRSPSTRARARTSSVLCVLSLPTLCAVWHRRSSARAASRVRSDPIARAIASAASTGISKRPRYSRQRAHRCRHKWHVSPAVRDCAAATCLRRARRPSPSPRCAPSAAKAPLARNPLAPPQPSARNFIAYHHHPALAYP